MPNLLSLFDDKLKKPSDLVTSAPQTLETISPDVEEQEHVLKALKQLEVVKPKIDYSDFSNFVFFNSALDYFNITGEKILNEYPLDGTSNAVQAFKDELDGYQNYVLEQWPKSIGHLKFDPSVSSSYIEINDIGSENGRARAGRLDPGTGSMTLEFWCVPPPPLTGSTDYMPVYSKVDGNSYLFAGFTGSQIGFAVTGAFGEIGLWSQCFPGQLSYFALVLDRSTSIPALKLYSGSEESFPVHVATTEATFSHTGSISFSGKSVVIGSGSIPGHVVRPLTGSLDELRVWNVQRSLSDFSSSFNVPATAQKNLVLNMRFNETGSIPSSDGDSRIVLDSSGNKHHGRIFNYHWTMRRSGSLLPFDVPDPVLTLKAPAVRSYVLEQQASGTSYDRSNDNLITRLLPDQFFQMEEFKNTNVLQDFLYIMARQFDQTKQKIDQFINVLKVDYGRYDQAPDALLADVGKFFGWEFTGNFLSANTSQYLFGKGVLPNLESNKELDKKLYQIKNEFWKRSLINLMYIYKTKGTRESIEALFRVYGVNKNFIKLKEYGLKPAAGISTFRIKSEKSVPTLMFGSGSSKTSNTVGSEPFNTLFNTFEMNVKFPTTQSSGLQATVASGTLVSFVYPGLGEGWVEYNKNSIESATGSFSFYVTSSQGKELYAELTGAAVFDNEWYNLSWTDGLQRVIDVRQMGDLSDRKRFSGSLAGRGANSDLYNGFIFRVGASGTSGPRLSEFWASEVRVWSKVLSGTDFEDHAENFQSYGSQDPLTGGPDLHWRLNENVSFNADGYYSQVVGYSATPTSGVAQGFLTSTNSYQKMLRDYRFIAPPDYGWNEDKIRVISDTSVSADEAFVDNQNVALEFNMVDALNEDVSQIISSLDKFNNYIGLPANRYRASYESLDSLRNTYFSKLKGELNFRLFADMLEFFDRSFIDMVKRLIPVRANFLGDEFVVESHMLERPKLQWNYRRQNRPLQPEGTIQVLGENGMGFAQDSYARNSTELGTQSTSDKTDVSGVIRFRSNTVPSSVRG